MTSDDRSVDVFVWTDSRGGYDMAASSSLPTLTINASTTHEGYATQAAQRVVSAGSVTIDVTLVPAPFTLVGAVQDNQNRSAPFCEPITVEAVSGPSAGQAMRVSAPGDGSFRFGSLQPGTFTVRASAPGYYIRETTTRLRGYAPFNRVDFLLPRGPRPADGTRVDCSLPPLQ